MRQGARRVSFFVGSLLIGSTVCCGHTAAAFLQTPSLKTQGSRPDTWNTQRQGTSNSSNDDSPPHDVKEVAPETAAIVNEYVAKVKQALDEETFVSILLKGPTVSKKQRQDVRTKERLRGCIRQIQGRLVSLPKRRQDRTCLQTTIKYHGATDVAKNYDMDQVVSGLTSLLLSNSNAVASEWGDSAIYPCGSELGIQQGELQTTLGTWDLTVSHTRPIELKFKQPLNGTTKSTVTQPMSHDRTKDVPLSTKASFLQALGLTKPDGKPRPAMSSKLKQCQKFVEIVSGLIEASVTDREISSIETIDMGCGRAYLTFSLHTYLYEKYSEMVHSCGIDMRPKLVNEISGIARSLGSDFDGLTFQEGTIESILSSNRPCEKDTSSLNVLIALHACDTATDDALWCGIQNECDVLVVAPCCHKEVRRQLDRYVAIVKSNHPLADVLRHNIYRERIAETATDSLRALLLELANYNVQVFEFIGGEHTGKNVMITAVKRQRSRTKKDLAGLRKRVGDLASLHGVHEQRLAKWMNETLGNKANDAMPKRILSSKEMPPLS